jgi:cyanophycinase
MLDVMSRTKFVVLSMVLVVCALPGFAGKSAYQYYRAGSGVDVVRSTTGGTVLMGGGTDVDAAFQWMCARGGQGDFLVIRATGTNAYNPYIQQLCPVNSAATLVIPTRAAASDAFVISTIQKAEVIFIAGGDQSDYINYWKGTPVQTALNDAIARNVPIGGTSAGMDVLTQFIYSAQLSQGVTSSQALANPFSRYITLDRDFVAIPKLVGILGDAHFVTRDRMGRNLAFLCRLYTNGWPTLGRGIAVDEATALLIDTNGNASLVGTSTAYFLQAPGPALTCVSGVPLTYQNIAVQRISAGGTFNLVTWQGTGVTSYGISANAGVLSSTLAHGDIY